jgi:hypothetical protein
VGHINAALSKSADVQSQAQLCIELFAPDGAEIWGRLVRFANTPEMEEAELTQLPQFGRFFDPCAEADGDKSA